MKALKKVSVKWLLENQKSYTYVSHYYDYTKGMYNYFFRIKPSVFINSNPVSVMLVLKTLHPNLINL